MATPLIEARQVIASRPGDAGTLQVVLDDVSVAVSAGEIVAVVGPSGSGKSTLLRLFNRLLEPDAGEVHFEGRDVRSLSPPILRSHVAMLSQKPYLFEGTVHDNLLMPARLRRSTQAVDVDLSALLELCQISRDLLTRDGRRLSLGQQQRVCLARTLMGPCQALLLDEPTSALDRPTAETLATTFRDLAAQRRLAILLVTHDLDVARLCADHLLVMINGRIVERGLAQVVMNEASSAEARAFLGLSAARSGGPA